MIETVAIITNLISKLWAVMSFSDVFSIGHM